MTENEQEGSPTDAFNALAKQAIIDFPQMEGKLAFYDEVTDTLSGNFLADPAEKEQALKIGRHFIEVAASSHSSAFVLDPSFEGEGLYIINNVSMTEEDKSDTLRHEIGHLVVPGGTQRVHGAVFAECAAEVFCYLYRPADPFSTQLKRLTEKELGGTAGFMFVGEHSHFYHPVLPALKEMYAKYDLSTLSPRAAADFAYRFCFMHAMRPETMQEYSAVFQDTRQDIPFDEKIQEVAKIMFADHGKNSTGIYIMARNWINQFLTPEDAEYRATMLTPEFWNDLQEKISAKDKVLKEESESPRSRATLEIQYMMATGHFDKETVSPSNLKEYESPENMAYIQRAADIYASIRTQAAQQKVRVNPEKVAALARKTAQTTAAPAPHTPKSSTLLKQ